jgi:hypothetical protein
MAEGQDMSRGLLAALAILALTRMAACGGGGGADSSSSTTTTTGATCALIANTTATSTVTSGCALLARDTSSCQASRTAQGLTGAWLKFSCRVTLTVSGQNVLVSADSQPDYKTSYFPTGNACALALAGNENPNRIAAQAIAMNVPLTPNATGQAMPLGTVGMAVNGVALFSNVAAPGDDIYLEAATFDPCQAHPTQSSVYHYHSEPYAISSNDANLIGVMRDGYFVYGQKDLDGTTPILDAAGGHTSPTLDSGGIAVYHYHANPQTSTAATSLGTTAVFVTKGTYKGTPGTCTGC